MNWGVSSYFGWGVYGLNLALAWARDPDMALVALRPVDPGQLALDPVRLRALGPFIAESRSVRAQLAGRAGQELRAQAPLLASLDPEFRILTVDDVQFGGTPSIGVTFFETAVHGPEAIGNARRHPLIVTGSTWNERVLRAHGLTNVRTILQGVDPSLFHPAPSAGGLKDRFLVFSGGKLELRKGQDIALAAFRRFAERRPDATLVASWHSPWPQLARSVDRTGLAAPVAFDAEGRLDATAWAVANGVRREQFLDAGATPNPLMPQLLRQMDVALFPNRCEGGTNLVAMECMACGVPTILSANSGHLDLIGEDNGYVLTQQGEVAGDPRAAAFGQVPGWGESDVDEAVELLERAYLDREDARRRGARGAAFLQALSWERTAAELKAAVLGLAPAEGG
jgi:glycosyltransferase involved in cell wall biosynthesis